MTADGSTRALGSFVNVTLAFWSDDNGIAIGPDSSQVGASTSSQDNEKALFPSTGRRWEEEGGEEGADSVGSPLPRGKSSDIVDSVVRHLINGLGRSSGRRDAGDEEVTLENETFFGNVSELSNSFLRDNVTNDTTDCWSSALGTNGCTLLGNVTDADLLDSEPKPEKVYWALFLVLLPFLAVFGNILVILSVYKERSLQSVTNYFIVSLAFADLLVAGVVMPFAVYFLVNVDWELSQTVCDFWIAVDVTCSTASILNLVAISIDRFIAVTQPITYANHKSNNRVALTIAIVWIVSVAIGSPIVLGLNTSPERIPELCIFYNSDFIIYSSLGSFYIPCVLMVFLYYKIFKAIRDRAKKQLGSSRKPYPSSESKAKPKPAPALVLENTCHTKLKDADHAAGVKSNRVINKMKQMPLITETDAVTNNGSGSGSQVDDDLESDDKETGEALGCQVIANEKTGQNYELHTRKGPKGGEEQTTPGAHSLNFDLETTIGPNGNTNTDSGYAPSNIEETQFCVQSPVPPTVESPVEEEDVEEGEEDEEAEEAKASAANDTSAAASKMSVSTSRMAAQGHSNPQNQNQNQNQNPKQNKSGYQTQSESVSVSVSGSTQASVSVGFEKKKSRFNLGRKHKSSRKKREKASAKRERKATKTLAIVLGVFLFCWVPFFTCNIMDAICIKLDKADCRLGTTAFLLTTWLGYMNSIVNPVIYTIFNPEFRKAFKKILTQPLGK